MPKKTKNRPTREEFMARCQAMYDNIAAKIENKILVPGSSLSAEGDFSKKFGISRESVRRVIEQMASHGLVTRIKGKGVVVGQAPESGKVKTTVGIVVSSQETIESVKTGAIDPFVLRNRYATLLSALEHKFTEAGVDVRFFLRDFILRGSIAETVAFLKEEVGGLAIVYDSSKEMLEFASAAANAGVGIVFLPMYVPCPPLTSGVAWDNYQVGRIAANHLLELGHRKLTCLALDCDFDWMHPRISGFEDACRQAGVSFNVIKASVDQRERLDDAENRTFKIGRRHASDIVKRSKSTAVFAVNDELAYGVYDALMAQGLAIPRDFSIVGCDNDYGIPWHGLTTISLECIRTAEAAASAVISYLRHENNLIWPVDLKMPPRLIVRESTMPPK